MTVALVAFWVALALLVWVYIGYPVVCWLYGRVRPAPAVRAGSPASVVTVGIAVHNAESQIADRLANILSQEVPFELDIVVASDGSTDSTGAVVRTLAASNPRLRLLELPRSGQSAAQSAIFESARGEIVVLTDAETRFEAGCLRALVAPFGSAKVGCVTGILRWRYDARSPTAQHEGLYWRYEQAVRAWESRAGWLSAGTGALLAVRRSIYRPAPAHASLDQMLPLYCREAGGLVVVAANAIGTDRGAATVPEQFDSRARIATQGIEANLRMSTRIRPWRMPGSFLAIWSHKILRWATPFVALMLVLAGAGVCVAGGSWVFLLPAAVAAGVAALATVGYVAVGRAVSVPLTGLPSTIVVVNLAFAAGWVNVLTRRRVRAWEAH